jgi:hypothetical protein
MEPVSLGAAVGLALVAGIGGWVGAYYGAYWKKKGEQAATHEDLENLVKEVQAVTKTTEEIKSEISGGLWDRQKQWELKRDVMFEAAKTVSAAKDRLTGMHAICMTDKEAEKKGKPIRLDKQAEAYAAFNKAGDKLDEAFMLVAIACGDDVRNKVGAFGLFARNLAVQIAEGNPEKFLEKADELSTRFTDVAKAIRAEVGFGKNTKITSQSKS